MNPAKTQIKIGTISELGVKYDDMREAAEREVIRKEGYHLALNEIQQSTLRSIFERVDAERDAGRFDLPTSSLIKEYLAKVHSGIDNLRLMNENHRLIAQGRVLGLKDAIGFAKKTLDGEQAKLAAIEAQVTSGAITPEAPSAPSSDVRPDALNSALNDINRRRAQARESKVRAGNPAADATPKRGRPKGSKNPPKAAGA